MPRANEKCLRSSEFTLLPVTTKLVPVVQNRVRNCKIYMNLKDDKLQLRIKVKGDDIFTSLIRRLEDVTQIATH